MNKQCNIVRDLMPLTIDGAASEDSRRMVEAHVAECEPCAEVYRAMKAAPPESQPISSDAERMIRALYRKKLRRVLKIVLLGVLIGAVLTVGFTYSEMKLRNEKTQAMPIDNYTLAIARTRDGKGVIIVRQKAPAVESGLTFEERVEDGKTYLYVLLEQAVFPRKIVRPTQAYSAYATFSVQEDETGVIVCHGDTPSYIEADGQQVRMRFDTESGAYAEIRQGTPSSYVTLWKQGDDLPYCSEEMEAYFQAKEEYWDMLTSLNSYNELASRSDLLETMRQAVPEWQ